MNMSSFALSVKKESWEFKKIFFWTPIALAALTTLGPLIQLFLLEEYQKSRIIDALKQFQAPFSEEMISQGFFSVLTGLFVPFIMIAFLVQLYYFLACLFDERRDMSVYFWRSLPVSDTMTIGTKLLTGALIIPAIFMAAATATMLLFLVFSLFVCIFVEASYNIDLWHMWGSADIVSNLFAMWSTLIPYTLWLMPIFAWLLLASMFAKKAPFIWAAFPIVAIVLVEAFIVKYFGLSSTWFAQWLMDYFSITNTVFEQHFHKDTTMQAVPAKVLMSKVEVIPLIVSAGFVYLTYWLRVNRSQG